MPVAGEYDIKINALALHLSGGESDYVARATRLVEDFFIASCGILGAFFYAPLPYSPPLMAIFNVLRRVFLSFSASPL